MVLDGIKYSLKKQKEQYYVTKLFRSVGLGLAKIRSGFQNSAYRLELDLLAGRLHDPQRVYVGSINPHFRPSWVQVKSAQAATLAPSQGIDIL